LQTIVIATAMSMITQSFRENREAVAAGRTMRARERIMPATRTMRTTLIAVIARSSR
jgi:hypothetical protein